MLNCPVNVAVGDPKPLGAPRTLRLPSEKALTTGSNNERLRPTALMLSAARGSRRAKERMNRALLIDPDNWNMRTTLPAPF